MVQNGSMKLGEVCKKAADEREGSETIAAQMEDVSVEGGLSVYGDRIAEMDDAAWRMFSRLLDIPTPYFMRLERPMREANAGYWLKKFFDKDITMVVKDGKLISLSAGMEIDMLDVLDSVYTSFPGSIVLDVEQSVSSTVLDIISPEAFGSVHGESWRGGVRLAVKPGLRAPDIHPLLVGESTSCIVEFAELFEPLSIKSMSYRDIIRMVSERAGDCISSLDSMIRTFGIIDSEDVPEPRRRIVHLCREHGVSDRLKSKVMGEFDDHWLSGAESGDIIMLFGTLGLVGGVGRAGGVRLQRVAGHMISSAHSEHRCSKCDSLEVVA